jgi:hypothetical protein
VVKHSVVRIHGVVVFALTFIAVHLLTPVRVHVSGDVLAALMIVASLVIGASTRSIGRAIGNPHR